MNEGRGGVSSSPPHGRRLNCNPSRLDIGGGNPFFFHPFFDFLGGPFFDVNQ